MCWPHTVQPHGIPEALGLLLDVINMANGKTNRDFLLPSLGFGALGERKWPLKPLGRGRKEKRVQYALGLRWGEFSIFTILSGS